MAKKNVIKFTEKSNKKDIASSSIANEFAKTSLVRSVQRVAMEYKGDILKNLYNDIQEVITKQKLQKICFKRLPGMSIWLDTIETEITGGEVFELLRGIDANGTEYTIGVMATESDVTPTFQDEGIGTPQLQQYTVAATGIITEIMSVGYDLIIRKRDTDGVISILTSDQKWFVLEGEDGELFRMMDGELTTFELETDQEMTSDNPLSALPENRRDEAVMLARLVERSQGRLSLVLGPGKIGYIAVPACRQDTGMCFAQRKKKLLLCQFVDVGNIDENQDTNSLEDIVKVMPVAGISLQDALRFTETLRTGEPGSEDMLYRMEHEGSTEIRWLIPLSVSHVLEILGPAIEILYRTEFPDDLTDIEQNKLDTFLGEVHEILNKRYL